MEIEFIKPFGMAIVLGAALFGLWFAAIVGAGIWGRVWAWVDDQEQPKRNPLTSRIMKAMGYEDDQSDCMPYRKRDAKRSYSDGCHAVFLPGLALFAAPPLALLALTIYPVTIGAFTLYLLARLARFARRHKKLFDKHIADPDAHKN